MARTPRHTHLPWRILLALGAPIALTLTLLLSGCAGIQGAPDFGSGAPTATPSSSGIYFPARFHWNDAPTTHNFHAPLTEKSPGPVATFTAARRVGVGATLDGDSLASHGAQAATAFFADETARLQQAGWRPLFTPTAAGAYPTSAWYVTYQQGKRYCFVEYSVTVVSANEATQRIDVYFN